MPLITGKLDNRRAIVDIGLHPSLVVQSVGPVVPPLKIDIEPLRGLIDTGAQMTCITRKTAARVGLRPMGKRLVGNVSNLEYHTSYSFILGVWYSQPGGDSMNETRGYFAFDPVLGCDFKDNDDFDVLIGMDIIQQGDFATKKDGTFTWQVS